MKQGYNDRMDDSLGNRDGKKSSKEQNYKDRRDEAKAMNKAEGKRAYQSAESMDKNSFDKTWAKFKADTKKAFGGKYAKGGGVGESDDCPEYFLEVEGDTQKAYELLKKGRWLDETSTRVYNDLEDIKGFVSNDKESLSRAETYLDSKGISTSVIYNLKDKFYADFEELQAEDGNNSIFITMYFSISDRINPDDSNDTMTLVETANKNALNNGLIYDIEELGKQPIYKEISDTALKNIRLWWKENIEEIYLSKIPKYIKSEMPKGTPTYADAERIANKGVDMFYNEFEKKFKEYLNIMEGGFSKGYAKGGGVDDTYKKMIEAKGKQFAFERILKDSQFYQTNEMDKDDFIYDKNGRDVRAYPSNEKIDLYINWRSSNSSQKVTFNQPSELAEYLDNNQIYAKGGSINNYDWKSKPLTLRTSDWEKKINYPRYHNFNGKKYNLIYNFNSKAEALRKIKDIGMTDTILQPIKYSDGKGGGLPKYFVYVSTDSADQYAKGGDVEPYEGYEEDREEMEEEMDMYIKENDFMSQGGKMASGGAVGDIVTLPKEHNPTSLFNNFPKGDYKILRVKKGNDIVQDGFYEIENANGKKTWFAKTRFSKLTPKSGKMASGGKIFNLDPVDGRKSFYGKAKGINLGNTTQLQSYDTIVAEYDNVNKKMTINDYYSPTTARHINSFLDYYGYPTMSKSEMLAVKGTKFAKGGMVSSNYFSGMLSFLNY